MDCIRVNNIKAYGYTGFIAEERVLGQWFIVDLTMWVDLQKSGNSDDLTHSVDYRHAINLTKEIIQNAKFALVEKLAEVIAQDILKLDLVTKVRVKLSKPAPPIPDFDGQITIDIVRSQ